MSLQREFFDIIKEMNEKLKEIKFLEPIKYVYNPTEYAFYTYSMYIEKYGSTPKKIMFLGMNPGPWGMVQTGVPFGGVPVTRDWLQISGPVGTPRNEHPDRRVTGFGCDKIEISSQRFWEVFQEHCETPEMFFKNAFIYNYCPLAFLRSNGYNFTPEEIEEPSTALKELTEICDEALYKLLLLLKVEIVVGIGRFAEKRARAVISEHLMQNIRVIYLLHPSPRVENNDDWTNYARQFLASTDLLQNLLN